MFERFTDRSRKVMTLANEAAKQCNHESIGKEHILLGLSREGIAGQVLADFGVTIENARNAVRKTLGQDQPSEPCDSHEKNPASSLS